MKDNWTYKKLGEVSYYPNRRVAVSDLPEYSYVGVENLIKDKGGVSFSGTVPNIDSAIECLKNDILIGNIRPYLRKIWLADRNVGASGDIVVIRINPDFADKLNPNYLYAVLSSDSFFNYDNANTKGAKMPRGDRKVIANFVIPIPSLSEQLHIVSELNLLQGLISKQQVQLKELDNLAQSIFYEMFCDPVENEKGWEVKQIGDVCLPKKEIRRATKQFDNDEEISYIDISAIDNSKNIITAPTSLQFGDAPSRAQQIVVKDDILVSLVRPNLNNVALVTMDSSNLVASSGFCVLRASREVEPLFLFAIVKMKNFTEYLMQRVSGANYPAVREDDITGYKTIIPPLSLQQSFAEKIEAIENQKAAISQSIAETQKLFDYTMDKYFG